MLDIDPPSGGEFRLAVRAAQLVREALSGCGLAGAVKTSGAKGVHVFVPITQASAEDAAAATRAVAARAERLDPALTTTAFIRADREGKVFLDSTRAGGATVVAAYSPRIRPGVPVSFPLPWDELDRVTPADFTVRTAARLITPGARWAGQLPAPQHLPADLVAEGHTIPVARVQAMHEGKRRARARRAGERRRSARCFLRAPAPRKHRADAGPRLPAVAPGAEAQPAEGQQRDPQPPPGPSPNPKPSQGRPERRATRPCQAAATTTTSSTTGSSLGHGRLDRGAARRAGRPGPGRTGAGGRAGLHLGQVVGEPGQVGLGLGAHRPAEPLVQLGLVEAAVPVVLGQLVGDLGPLGVGDSHAGIGGALARSGPRVRSTDMWRRPLRSAGPGLKPARRDGLVRAVFGDEQPAGQVDGHGGAAEHGEHGEQDADDGHVHVQVAGDAGGDAAEHPVRAPGG